VVRAQGQQIRIKRVIFFFSYLYNPFVNFLIMTICVYLFITLNDKVLLSLEFLPYLPLRITFPTSSPSFLTFNTFLFLLILYPLSFILYPLSFILIP
jgi:hypothetical protein